MAQELLSPICMINKLKEMAKKAEKTASKKKSSSSKEVTELEEKVSTLEAELETQNDKYLRLVAEFENFKKRTVKEKIELMKNAAEDTVKSILPVLDDFDRAKQSAEDDSSTEQFSDGVLLVYNKLYSVLESKGLSPMTSTGEIFDPELFEAITEIPAPSEEEKGSVIDTVSKGYYLNDKIIRHAKVVVGK